ncbi:MAG: hypothetical protein ACOY71_07265 [Gemmatimonadota bacterium]
MAALRSATPAAGTRQDTGTWRRPPSRVLVVPSPAPVFAAGTAHAAPAVLRPSMWRPRLVIEGVWIRPPPLA